MQEYDTKCLKMYLITLFIKKMFAPINEGESITPCPSTLEVTYSSGSGLEITKVNDGESNTPCPSTLEVTYSSVEKLSKSPVQPTSPKAHWSEVPLVQNTTSPKALYKPPQENLLD
jgi:hypothetical protein